MTTLWNKYPLYERDGEFVLLDPISLNSVFLSGKELSILNDTTATSSKLFTTLRNMGFAPEPSSTSARSRVLERLSRAGLASPPDRVNGLRVVLTDKCNMTCDYCFVKTNTGHPDMTEKDLRQGLEYLFVSNAGQDEVQVQWFGGEPSLRFDLIQIGDSLVTELASRHGIGKVRRVLVTNGLRMTDQMIAHLQQFEYSVGISYDGPPSVNRQFRVLRSGEAVDDRIEKTIKLLVASDNISVGLNLTPTPANVATLDSVVVYAIETLGVRFIYVNTPIPASGRWEVDGNILAESLFRARIRAFQKGAMLFSVADMVYQALDARRPTAMDHLRPGNAIRAALLPGGKISVCDINWKDAKFIFDLDELARKPELLSVVAKPLMPHHTCAECPAMTVCGGPSTNDISLMGSSDPDPQFCALYTRLLELALWDSTQLQ